MPEYFIYKRQGPYGIHTLSQLVQNGEVDNYSFVWTPGKPSLEYAKKMPELRPWFEEMELKNEKIKIEAPPYAEDKTIPAPRSVAPGAAPSGYKVAVNGQSTGPFSVEQLAGKIHSGEVLPETLVWKPGLTRWVPAQTMEDLAAAFRGSTETRRSSPAASGEEKPHEAEEFAPADFFDDEGPTDQSA